MSSSPIKGGADNLNGLDDKTDSSHATARPSRRAPCWLSRAWTPWIPCTFSISSSEGYMGPGNSTDGAGECVTRWKVSSSMERREMRAESRGRWMRRCGTTFERADLCVGRSGGALRESSGRPCIRRKRVSLWTPGGLKSGAHDLASLSSSSRVRTTSAYEVQPEAQSSMPHSESALADSCRRERTHSQSCVTSTSAPLPGMTPAQLFILSDLSCGIGVDFSESAGRAVHALKWVAARAGGAMEGPGRTATERLSMG